MTRMVSIVLFLVTLLCIQSCKAQNNRNEISPQPVFRHDGMLAIHSATGELIAEFAIEVVQKESELAQGLMFRESMQPEQGMLFVFEQIDYHSFWMKDTYLSLDMLFIDQYNTIVSIAENTPPFSEEQIVPDAPVKYVLEVLAGTSQRLNIKETDTISWHYLKD